MSQPNYICICLLSDFIYNPKMQIMNPFGNQKNTGQTQNIESTMKEFSLLLSIHRCLCAFHCSKFITCHPFKQLCHVCFYLSDRLKKYFSLLDRQESHGTKSGKYGGYSSLAHYPNAEFMTPPSTKLAVSSKLYHPQFENDFSMVYFE